MLLKRGLVQEVILFFFYALFVVSIMYVIFVSNSYKTMYLIKKNYYESLYSKELLIIYQLLSSPGEPTNKEDFLSNEISISELGNTFYCNGKNIKVFFILSKLTTLFFIEPFYITKIIGMPDSNLRVKVYDGKEFKTFSYDFLTDTLSFDPSNGVLMDNQKIFIEKRYTYFKSFPILLIEPLSNCGFKKIKVDYGKEIKYRKMVPAILYLEIYK